MSGTLHTSDARRARHEAVLRRFEDAWRSGSRPDLRDFLGTERTPNDLLLELVCTDLEYAFKNGLSPRAEDYLAQHPEFRDDEAALREITALEADLRKRFTGYAGEVTLAPSDPPQLSHPQPLPDDLPNYHILGELGRGGMGVVYKARQVRLQRFVALKMILAGEYAGPDASVRFLAEAEVTARLQHPNIVQIHDLGTHAGRPFLALEFVDGPSLGQIIAGTPQDPRLSAQLIHQLALAVAHAHDRGVIHRDLKPANVLLGYRLPVIGDQPRTLADYFGPKADSRKPIAVKITDFGLARHGTGGMTLSGAVVGTPSYMAPEQAAANRTAVGPAADIYSLGAILYELLTGRPPFRGTTAWETVEQVQTQEPVPPTRLQPRLPRDLETICLKCLDKNPAARYATAQALAEDLDRFLKHEPIRARRINLLERGVRWCRREPRTAGLIAVAILILLIGVGVTLTLLRQGSQQEEAHFQELLADVEHGLTFAGREEMALVPQLDDNLRKFLERLAERCRRLVAQRQQDTRLRRRVAEVQHQVGVIYQLLGRHEDAEAAFRAAVAARTELTAAADTTRQDELDLALSNYELAGLYAATGRLQEADQCLAQALALQVLVENDSSDPAQAQRAATLHRLAGLQLSVGNLVESEQSYRDALLLRQKLLDVKPEAVDAALDLAQTEAGLAEYLTLLGQLVEAEQLYATAINRQADKASAPGMRLALARCLMGQGRLAEVQDDRKGATAAYQRAVELLKRLGEDHPHRPDYRLEMAAAVHNLARFRNDTGTGLDPLTGALTMEAMYRDAVAEQEKLVAKFPAVVEYRRQLAQSLNTLATWVNDSAEPINEPINWERVREAESLHLRSEAIWQQLAAEFPNVPAYRHGLTISHQRFGIVLDRLKKFNEAEERYRAGLAIQQELTARFPNLARHHGTLAALNNNLGVIRDHSGQQPEAETYFLQAHVHAKKALALSPRSLPLRISYALQCYNLASVINRQGRYQEAVPHLRDYLSSYEHTYYELAKPSRLLNECLQRAERDTTRPDSERRALINEYTDLLLDIVKTRAQRGEESGQLEQDKSYERLRERAEFQKVLEEVRVRERKGK